MIRYYVLPMESSADGLYRGPAYFRWRFDPNPPGIDCPWGIIDYGVINTAVLCADIPQADHDGLVTHTDVYAFTENLDATMPQGEQTALTSFLEADFVPATNWLTGVLTYRQVLRTVTAMCLFMQRLSYGPEGNPMNWGITLNTQWRNLSAARKTAITSAFTSLGYSTSFIGNNTTMRQLIKNAADQWGAKPIAFGPGVL